VSSPFCLTKFKDDTISFNLLIDSPQSKLSSLKFSNSLILSSNFLIKKSMLLNFGFSRSSVKISYLKTSSIEEITF